MRPLLLLLLLLPTLVWANAAAPHYRFPSGQAVLLYGADSALASQVYLRSERILIRVYPGYAVVYGRYVFAKGDAQPATLTLGYPVYGELRNNLKQGAEMYEEYRDTPQHLRAYVNGMRMQTGETPADSVRKKRPGQPYWIVWPAKFESDTIVCEVYFLIDTHDGYFRHGYRKEKGHALGYLLHSGAVWLRPIKKGEIYLHLMEGLGTEHLKGLNPNAFSHNGGWLRWTFSNLKPMWHHNVLLRYEGEEQPLPKNPEGLYREIARDRPPTAGSWERYYNGDLHKVEDNAYEFGVTAVILLIVVLPIALLVLLLWLGYRLWRRYMRPRRN